MCGRGQSNRNKTLTKSRAEEEFEFLSSNAVDILPEEQLRRQLEEGKKLKVKLGVDPTAPDIHLGHTIVLTALKRFQDRGHEIILIIGDQTAMVGDPTGKSKTRPILTKEDVLENSQTFVDQVTKILDPELLNVKYNSEWLDMRSSELFNILSNNTVAQILDRDDFSKRFRDNKPISMLEMIYPVLQAYDSVAIDADIEVGGTDQKFNLLFGRELQGKMSDRTPQSILTLPILTGLDGTNKMSKSSGNYISLNDTPEDMYAKTLSIPDTNIPEYYKLLFYETVGLDNPRDKKRELARKIVSRFYTSTQASQAERTFDQKFSGAIDIEGLKESALKKNITSEVLGKAPGSVHLPALLSQQFDMTRSQARRHLQSGAVKINGNKVDTVDVDLNIVEDSLLSVGKRNVVFIEKDAK